MMTKLRGIMVTLLIVASMATAVAVPPSSVLADAASTATAKCNSGFLSFPAWYRGLTKSDTTGGCDIESPTDAGGLSDFIWIIVLNVIEILLQVIAYIAFIMIIVGGFRFLTSAGNASGVEQGKKTLTNAIIGLIISLAAIAIVKLVFGLINGGTGN